jgi:glycosyltransferase involved in cell wall biosynthesis
MAPAVSIILPTYNRASFLPEALASIRAQSFQDWDLVVVDDGSTDRTRAIVEAWAEDSPQPVSYVWQENGGAYAARNTGLDRAAAPFVAFFDSDDLWWPQHLERCVAGFADAPEVDWIFGACEVADTTGRLVQRSTFFDESDRPRRFLSLRTHERRGLRVIDDARTVEWLLLHGIYCGLQNSVIRARVFERDRFWEDYRVVEDSQFLLRSLTAGRRLAYFMDVHVTYRMHEQNSSASAVGANRRQLRAIIEEKVRGLERLKRETRLTPREQRAMNHNLAREYFWRLGYACCWEVGDHAAAMRSMREALRLTPLDLRMVKTYLACSARARLRGQHAGSS